MSKVSTRPPVGATIPPSPPVAAAAPVESEKQPVVEVAKAARELLQPIMETFGGNACALIEIADRTLCRAEESGDEEPMYEAEALLVAAHGLVAAEQPDTDADKRDRLHQAAQLVESATISFGFARDACEDLADGLRAGRTLAEQQLILTGAQYRTVLDRLAGELLTLRQLISIAQGGADEWVSANALDAAYNLASHLGATADLAGDCGVNGGALDWFCGPNFHSAGKAVQA